jgi:hypothetical protein
MKKNMHAKTLAIVLATTTTLQVTGITSQLLNGVPFATANAAEVSGGTGILTTTTTSAAVLVGNPGIGIVDGQVAATVPTSVESESYLSNVISIQVTTGSSATLLGTTDAAVTWVYNLDRTEVTGKIKLQQIKIGGNNYDLLPPAGPTSSILEFKVSIQVTPTPIPTPTTDVTTPSAVIIRGTERVGKLLEARLLKADATKFTTTAAVTYKWYRVSSKTSTSGTLVGDDKTYRVVGSDKGHYIKLIATFNGKSFEDITSEIERRASSSSSSSSSGSSSSNNDGTATSNNSTSGVGFEKTSNGAFKIVENGHLVAGWKQINGAWYLADSIGTMQTGWQQSNGIWYLLKNDGVMASGWQLEGGNWYLLNNNGAMATGWQESNGKWYYLYSDGSMASGTVIDGYRLDITGEWIK